MSYRNTLDEAVRQGRIKDRLILAILALLLFAMFGWYRARENIQVHVRPGLSDATLVRPGQVPAPNVYSFALYILQQLNRWADNGTRDYPQRIAQLTPYLTPRCRQWLTEDASRRDRLGELRGRTRALLPLPGQIYSDDFVTETGPRQWVASVDMILHESVGGQPVKAGGFRWQVRITTLTADPETNRWGLGLACFVGDGPTRLDPAYLARYGIDASAEEARL